MTAFMQGLESQLYAALRIVAGLLFLFHGTQKLFGFPIHAPDGPAFVIYGAGSIELVGGVLVMIGLMTRWVAFLCGVVMAAAYGLVHASQAFFPIENHGELAVLYCFLFLFISARGPGIWSVDGSRGGA